MHGDIMLLIGSPRIADILEALIEIKYSMFNQFEKHADNMQNKFNLLTIMMFYGFCKLLISAYLRIILFEGNKQ